MKRELKFRAWSPNRNGFVGSCYSISTYTSEGFKLCGVGEGDDVDDLEDDGLVIQQFTGLQDKNGKDVYEGDLLKHDENSESDKAVVVVVYKTEQAKFYCDEINDSGYGGDLDEWIGCEIVGNIFETPSLLHTGA